MASRPKSICTICGISVCRLSRHLETVHGETTTYEQERAKLIQRRLKCAASDFKPQRSYLRCSYTKEGEQCNILVLEKG